MLRDAVASGRAERDINRDLLGALAATSRQHRGAKGRGGALLRAIDGYSGSVITRRALRLAPLVFVRPGELRMAEWAEFNLDESEWRIPAARMKKRSHHSVALSTHAVGILRELQPLTSSGRFVFAGERDRSRPMSNNTVNAALRLQYGDNGARPSQHGVDAAQRGGMAPECD